MTLIFGLCQAIFQFFARPGNVDNYGFNFNWRHPLSLYNAHIN